MFFLSFSFMQNAEGLSLFQLESLINFATCDSMVFFRSYQILVGPSHRGNF